MPFARAMLVRFLLLAMLPLCHPLACLDADCLGAAYGNPVDVSLHQSLDAVAADLATRLLRQTRPYREDLGGALLHQLHALARQVA